MAIHPTAIIHPTAKIDPTAEVGPNVVVEEEVTIGPRCRLWPNAYIAKYTTMGEENLVHMGAVIGHLPQDLTYKNLRSYTRIGNGNIFREYSQIHRGTAPESSTVIGNKCFFMAVSHAGHNCQIGNEVIVANNALLAGYVQVGDRAFVSGNCVVHQHVRIGKLAIMSGASRVSKDIPPFMIADGTNLIAAVNTVGLRRGGFSPATRKAIKETYQILYRSGLAVSSALDQIEREIPDPEVRHLIEFVRASKRGICRHRRFGETGARSHAPDEETAALEF